MCGLGGLLFLGTSNDVSVCDLAKLTCFVFGTCVVMEGGGGGTTGGKTGRGPSSFMDSSSSGTQVYLGDEENLHFNNISINKFQKIHKKFICGVKCDK